MPLLREDYTKQEKINGIIYDMHRRVDSYTVR